MASPASDIHNGSFASESALHNSCVVSGPGTVPSPGLDQPVKQGCPASYELALFLRVKVPGTQHGVQESPSPRPGQTRRRSMPLFSNPLRFFSTETGRRREASNDSERIEYCLDSIRLAADVVDGEPRLQLPRPADCVLKEVSTEGFKYFALSVPIRPSRASQNASSKRWSRRLSSRQSANVGDHSANAAQSSLRTVCSQPLLGPRENEKASDDISGYPRAMPIYPASSAAPELSRPMYSHSELSTSPRLGLRRTWSGTFTAETQDSSIHFAARQSFDRKDSVMAPDDERDSVHSKIREPVFVPEPERIPSIDATLASAAYRNVGSQSPIDDDRSDGPDPPILIKSSPWGDSCIERKIAAGDAPVASHADRNKSPRSSLSSSGSKKVDEHVLRAKEVLITAVKGATARRREKAVQAAKRKQQQEPSFHHPLTGHCNVGSRPKSSIEGKNLILHSIRPSRRQVVDNPGDSWRIDPERLRRSQSLEVLGQIPIREANAIMPRHSDTPVQGEAPRRARPMHKLTRRFTSEWPPPTPPPTKPLPPKPSRKYALHVGVQSAEHLASEPQLERVPSGRQRHNVRTAIVPMELQDSEPGASVSTVEAEAMRTHLRRLEVQNMRLSAALIDVLKSRGVVEQTVRPTWI